MHSNQCLESLYFVGKDGLPRRKDPSVSLLIQTLIYNMRYSVASDIHILADQCLSSGFNQGINREIATTNTFMPAQNAVDDL